MTFTTPTKSASAIAEDRAIAIVKAAEHTKSAMINLWVAQWELFWQIRKFKTDGEGNASITVAEVQAYLDAMGVAAIEQLTEAVTFVTTYAAELDPLYHTTPFPLDTTTTPGRLIINGEMSDAWKAELELD